MAITVPVKINNTLRTAQDTGRTLVFDIAVTQATAMSRSVLTKQSTSALVPKTDAFMDITKQVEPNDFWVIDDFKPKYFVMVQAPYEFKLLFNDHTLANTLTLDVKRLFAFAGSFNGRLHISSQISQTIQITYA